MNPSDWIKATALVTQHKQEAATTETDQMSSPIAMDDSSPPEVHYGMHVPTVTSTSTGTDVHVHSSHGNHAIYIASVTPYNTDQNFKVQ